MFVRPGTRSVVHLTNNSLGDSGASFDLTGAGRVLSAGSKSIGHGITSAGNGWFRIWATSVPGSEGDPSLALYVCKSEKEFEYEGDETQFSLYVCGLQANEGITPTRHLPTSGAAVSLEAQASTSIPAESEPPAHGEAPVPQPTRQDVEREFAAPPLTDLPASTSLTQPSAQHPPTDAHPHLTRLLYAAWLAELFVFTLDPDIPDEGYEAAMELARRTALLAPDRRAAWDLALVLADQISSGNPAAAAAVRTEALAALARIDPADDVVRLSRIGDAIDRHSTAEARVRAYETMLDAKHRASIGAPVASRLAYQLASLESRMGNTDLFARWLGDSVKTDPSYPAAAQSAAGFFRMRVNDPAADVELLSIALEANPRNLSTWSALITVLLDGGAFKGAERVARMAIAVADAERRPETVYSMTGDLATALWCATRSGWGGGPRPRACYELPRPDADGRAWQGSPTRATSRMTSGISSRRTWR